MKRPKEPDQRGDGEKYKSIRDRHIRIGQYMFKETDNYGGWGHTTQRRIGILDFRRSMGHGRYGEREWVTTLYLCHKEGEFTPP